MDICCLQLGTITAMAGSYYHQMQFLVQMFILKSEMQAIAPLSRTKYMWQKQLLKNNCVNSLW